jgi:hypothetical protein
VLSFHVSLVVSRWKKRGHHTRRTATDCHTWAHQRGLTTYMTDSAPRASRPSRLSHWAVCRRSHAPCSHAPCSHDLSAPEPFRGPSASLWQCAGALCCVLCVLCRGQPAVALRGPNARPNHVEKRRRESAEASGQGAGWVRPAG